MILQSLVRQYEYLRQQGKLPPTGWSFVKVSYVLYINDGGDLEQIACIKQSVGETRNVKVPQQFVLPTQVCRSKDINPNFLADNSVYTFGIGKKGVITSKTIDRFLAYKEFHEKLLADVSCSAAQAVLAFFNKWNPHTYSEHPAFSDIDLKFFEDGNIIFRYKDQFLHEIPEIKRAWQEYYDNPADAPIGLCLVTGKRGPLALIHPPIKGVVGSSMSGGKLVSFNNEISYSDGHKGGWNAPISRYAAFAYTEALNYMLADKKHSFVIGDISVVCWAKGRGEEFQDDFFSVLNGREAYSDAEIQDMTGKVCKANPISFNESRLDPNCTFYILGLSCSKARISVRFFYENSFGFLLKNVSEHNKRLRIAAPDFEDPTKMSLWRLLKETKPRAKKGGKKEKPTAEDMIIYNDVLQSILRNERYPTSLCSSILNRISAEKTITPGKAAILKSYFLKSPHYEVPGAVLGESLDSDCENTPYVLGRMFSVLENIQWHYNSDTTDTIKNRFFDSAVRTPAAVYPELLELSEHHLKRLPEKKQYWIRGLLSEIKKKAGTEYPVSLTVPQQAAFYLGYYQQNQQRYKHNNNQFEEELENE